MKNKIFVAFLMLLIVGGSAFAAQKTCEEVPGWIFTTVTSEWGTFNYSNIHILADWYKPELDTISGAFLKVTKETFYNCSGSAKPLWQISGSVPKETYEESKYTVAHPSAETASREWERVHQDLDTYEHEIEIDNQLSRIYITKE